jgi:multisubunit Na+/H+ antiporter MnhB subunit
MKLESQILFDAAAFCGELSRVLLSIAIVLVILCLAMAVQRLERDLVERRPRVWLLIAGMSVVVLVATGAALVGLI